MLIPRETTLAANLVSLVDNIIDTFFDNVAVSAGRILTVMYGVRKLQ